MKFSPFSCPIFLGHPRARGRCSQGERVLYGGDLCSSGGTGKAEAVKLPGAGIGPKPCPGKCAAEKGQLPDSVSVGTTSRTTQRPARSDCNAQNSARGNPLISYGAMASFHVWLDWENTYRQFGLP